jgi:hypothetical protein
MIVTYTGANYKECLDLTLPTWQKYHDVTVYSDTEDFGIKMFEPSTDFNESCRRKILVIQRALKENPDIIYLDTDILLFGKIDVQKDYDIVATRMVHRFDKDGEKDINAGVSFWKSNERTLKFCEEWLKRDLEYRGKFKYPEQHAFSELCYEGYDGLRDVKVGNVSERLYNLEHDNKRTLVEWVKKYRQIAVHLKTQVWRDKELVDNILAIQSNQC